MVAAIFQVAEEAEEFVEAARSRATEWRDLVDLQALAETGLRILAIVVLSWIAYRVLVAVLRRIESAVADADPGTVSAQEQRIRTLLGLLRSVGVVFIAVIALFMVLGAVGLDIGPLLAGAGVVGLAISFGAQSLVRDIFSGLFILIENQFGVGDVIRIGDVTGRVEKLTLRIVVMRDDKGVHIIPNGEIKQVSNLTRSFAREPLDVVLAYSADVERALEIMREVADELWADPLWRPLLTEEVSVLGVESLAETSVRLRMMVTCIPLKQFDVARELRRRLKRRFDDAQIEFPQPPVQTQRGAAQA